MRSRRWHRNRAHILGASADYRRAYHITRLDRWRHALWRWWRSSDL